MKITFSVVFRATGPHSTTLQQWKKSFDQISDTKPKLNNIMNCRRVDIQRIT